MSVAVHAPQMNIPGASQAFGSAFDSQQYPGAGVPGAADPFKPDFSDVQKTAGAGAAAAAGYPGYDFSGAGVPTSGADANDYLMGGVHAQQRLQGQNPQAPGLFAGLQPGQQWRTPPMVPYGFQSLLGGQMNTGALGMNSLTQQQMQMAGQHGLPYPGQHGAAGFDASTMRPNQMGMDLSAMGGQMPNAQMRQQPTDGRKRKQQNDNESLESKEKTKMRHVRNLERAREKQGNKWQKEAAAHWAENEGKTNQANQVVAFRAFLERMQKKGLVMLDILESDDKYNPLGIKSWEVYDPASWWEDVRSWFEDDPSKYNERAFFMMLRRLGYKPFNKAPAPATSGLDYGLRNTYVRRHGYTHDPEVFKRYYKKR